jgi:hypothetical protein
MRLLARNAQMCSSILFTSGDLPQLLIGQISADFVLKRPAMPWHKGRGVQHGVLFEKGIDGVRMPIGMEQKVTEVLLLITPILAIGLHSARSATAFQLLLPVSTTLPIVRHSLEDQLVPMQDRSTQ